mmetsp:Transcript_54391/g.172799  ORF Transcript_54391/g.172799 Transcript_54391/m.172799 type:complete len:563 (+) Transcript_54391:163-1851(+)
MAAAPASRAALGCSGGCSTSGSALGGAAGRGGRGLPHRRAVASHDWVRAAGMGLGSSSRDHRGRAAMGRDGARATSPPPKKRNDESGARVVESGWQCPWPMQPVANKQPRSTESAVAARGRGANFALAVDKPPVGALPSSEGPGAAMDDLPNGIFAPETGRVGSQAQEEGGAESMLMEDSNVRHAHVQDADAWRDEALKDLLQFWEENRQVLGDMLPSREYLSDAGRTDLARMIRRLGGPAVVAYKLGLTWSSGDGESEMKEPAKNIAKKQDIIRRSPALASLVDSGGEGGGSGGVGGIKAVEPIPLPSVAGRGMGAAANGMDEERVLRAVRVALEKGMVLVVEHNTGPDGPFWTPWRSISSASAGTSGAGEVLEEAKLCWQQFPHSYVRVVGYDVGKQSEQANFVFYAPSDPPGDLAKGGEGVELGVGRAVGSGPAGPASWDNGLYASRPGSFNPRLTPGWTVARLQHTPAFSFPLVDRHHRVQLLTTGGSREGQGAGGDAHLGKGGSAERKMRAARRKPGAPTGGEVVRDRKPRTPSSGAPKGRERGRGPVRIDSEPELN